MRESTLTGILINATPMSAAEAASYVSVGLVVNDRKVVWTEFATDTPRAYTDSQKTDLQVKLSKLLVGQSLHASALADLISRLGVLESDGVYSNRPDLRPGLEQAIVSTVADAEGRSVAHTLAQVLTVGPKEAANLPFIVLEVDNTMATAAVMQRMIALAPGGLGYRLAAGGAEDAIGKQGEYLQRFVRELGILLVTQEYLSGKPPVIYLGLNGGLGALTANPWRELGQVLGHVSGLEKAAGTIPVWLEDPVLIEDDVVHAAALYQLRDYMRVREMGTRIVARAHTASLHDLQILCDTDAIDGACLHVEEWGGLVALGNAVSLLQASGKSILLGYVGHVTPDQQKFLLAMAEAMQVAAVLINVGEGTGPLPSMAVSHLNRERLWQQYLAGRNA